MRHPLQRADSKSGRPLGAPNPSSSTFRSRLDSLGLLVGGFLGLFLFGGGEEPERIGKPDMTHL